MPVQTEVLVVIDFNSAPRQATRLEDAEARKERIGRDLRNRIKDFVKYLYPHAIEGTSDMRVGDISGAPGMSMSIALWPLDKTGMWIDHATGDRGDIFALYARAQNLDAARDFATVLTECDAWANGRPADRMVARHIAAKARPVEAPPSRDLERTYVYRSSDGQRVIAEVRRYRLSNGKKTFVPYFDGHAGMLPMGRPLYGLERWSAKSDVVLVEGEKCVDALAMVGIDATTAMGGANTTIEKTDWTPLRGKNVWLWPDNDEPGFALMERLQGPLRALDCKVRLLKLPPNKAEGWDAADAIAEGMDVTAFLRQESETPPEHGLVGQWLEELAYAYEPELVEGLIPAQGVGVVFGPSSAGKSFVVVDWALRIASAGKVLGRFTEPAGVLYFAAEGQAGLRKRLVAARAAQGMDEVVLPFNYLPALLDLSRAETGDIERLCLYAEEASREMAQRGRALRVVFVDTLAAAAPSADENAQKDMGPVMLAFHRMAARLGAVVVLVAHTGKDVTRGLRGWSGIRANADFAIECRVEKDEETGETTRRSLWFEKCKDGPDGFVLSDYGLRQITLGKKRSGEPDTTCVIDWNPSAPTVKKAAPIYSGARGLIVKALQDGPKSTSEIAEELGVERSNANRKLLGMQTDGAIFARDDGPRKVWVLCMDELHTNNQQNQGVK